MLRIADSHLNHNDYVKEAEEFIEELYGYNIRKVLFKPTLASDNQFRLDRQAALSYFVGGNKNYSEDQGFALKGWESVRWENVGVHVLSDSAIAMGNYYFVNHNGELKVEFSFVYQKDDLGVLKIILHDSHFPYQK